MTALDKLDAIFRRHGVKIAYLFGSQKQRGIEFLQGIPVEAEKGSDLDIGIVFEKLPDNPFLPYGELYAELIDIFEPFDIDLVFLQETDSLFQYEAIRGEVIYYEDQDFLDEYEELIMKKAGDLAYKREEFERDFLEAIKDGYFEIEHR
jgi:predicted nucleotidyltransferase